MEEKKHNLEVGSDYSGVGAFDQALIRLGVPYKKVFACDFDYYARLTYVLNFGTEEDLVLAQSKEHKMFCSGMEFIILGKSEAKDISEFEKKCKKLLIDGIDLEAKKFNFSIAADQYATIFSFYYPFNVYDRQIPETPLDIFMTSPPCQAFSLAGKRLGKADIKGILFFNSLDFIEKNKPKTFMFENVKGLLSDDKTNKKALYGNTFQEWINYLGGKSVNGNPTFFPYEDSVPYHIYFKVLNAKEYGVPQNRERIFIIGIRDDSENSFDFPKTFPLVKRLKDVLEKPEDFESIEVFNEYMKKYFLSDKMIEDISFGKKPNGEIANLNKGGERGSVYDENSDIMSCLSASDYKQPKQILTSEIELNEPVLYNKIKYNEYQENESGISNTIISGGTAPGDKVPLVSFPDEIIQLNDPIHSNDRIYSDKGISPTLNTIQGGNRQPFVQVSDEVIQLNKSKESGGVQPYQHNRVYDINGLSPALDTDSGGIKNILVDENWIKGGLQENQPKQFNGIAPCLTSAMGMGGGHTPIHNYQQRIRRLTPTECFRLMNFNLEMIEKTISSGLISDSQLYKQAGNSICVEPLKLLIEKLLKIK